MKIDLMKIKIKDLFNGYVDSEDEGVVAYDGRLNVRPAYQREFVYQDKQRNAVIDTVRKGFPLNVMYWSKSGVNEKGEDLYELLDGQQRTISICQYLTPACFSINSQYFHNLTKEEQEQIENYELFIYVCEGTEKDKLDWFKTINIAGMKLTEQELRNAIYTGPWLSDAKKYFSKRECPAYKLGSKYVNGTPIRQEYLETVLEWICDRDGLNDIEDYMAIHQNDKNANDLKNYYSAVITWIENLFPSDYYRKEMKGIKWGLLYNKYHNNTALDADEIEAEIYKLMQDEDVTDKKGCYEYVLSGKDERLEKKLSIRTFTDKQKRTVYEKQKHQCPFCVRNGENKEYKFEEMEGDHITPWSKGGHTVIENLQMLCKKHNRDKSDI